MPTDTRDIRAIRQIECPKCGAPKLRQCEIPAKHPGPKCCKERRKANQARLRSVKSAAHQTFQIANPLPNVA